MAYKDPDKQRKYQREWRRDYREKVAVAKAGKTRPNGCEVCGGGTKRILSFDHDHKTGQFRGWLCSLCNTALGCVRDSQDTLLKLVDYLNKHSGK